MSLSVVLDRRSSIVGMICVACVGATVGRAQADDEETAALVGHWRMTRIEFESPKDYHLVLNGDGSAQTFQVTAGGQSGDASGTWQAQSQTLTLHMSDGSQASFTYTFFEGKLVLPNIPNQRGFWEKIE